MLSRNKVGVSEAVAGAFLALVAQLVEHLFYTQRVMGSSPIQGRSLKYHTHRLVVGHHPFKVKTWVQFPMGVLFP